MNDCTHKIEFLPRIQVCLLFRLTGTPQNSKTSLHKPYMRLTKYIFLYIWIYSWPAVITLFSAAQKFYLSCEVVASNHIWHPCPIGRTLCRVTLSILRWPQACSNVGKLPWQWLPRYQADGLRAAMRTHHK